MFSGGSKGNIGKERVKPTVNVLQVKIEVEFKIQVNWKKFKDTLKPIKFMLKLEKTILGNVVIWEKIGLK